MSRTRKLSRTHIAAALIAALLGTGAAGAQSPPAGPVMRGDGPPPKAEEFSITGEDLGLDDIVDPNAKARAALRRLWADGRPWSPGSPKAAAVTGCSAACSTM